jgi:NAD(P)-dependent dehydrogenase (short-subunit alcohol dehydrogenase family)
MSTELGTIIVTGANGGLGSAFVQKLIISSPQSHFIFTVRSLSPQSSDALKKILANSKVSYSIAVLDLSSLESVRDFSKDINLLISTNSIPKIRALVLNAAVQSFSGIQLSTDGFETMFQVNYLSNFLLVLRLLQSIDVDKGRIVMVSSFTHDPDYYLNSRHVTEKIIFKDPEIMAHPTNDDNTAGFAAGMRRYALSKLLLLMFMYFPFNLIDKGMNYNDVSISIRNYRMFQCCRWIPVEWPERELLDVHPCQFVFSCGLQDFYNL